MHRTVRHLVLLRVGRLVPSKARSVPQHANNNRNSERVEPPTCTVQPASPEAEDTVIFKPGPGAERKRVAAASECITSKWRGSSTPSYLKWLDEHCSEGCSEMAT
ncbi:hypothetical protein PF007_g21788 [Phytophthora fragariae]|uniref:Uncharacterized protein n=1 Tax=Phytophthora fragariae TaxID=53985 RepID=A0A6A3QUF7_9STRA|nr:hypothetical protein PF007_g21788 [Phytophthora fragariae]